MSQLKYEFKTTTITELLCDKTIEIPAHQRPEMWQLKRQTALIDTIMSGRPMPNITLRSEVKDSNETLWLEDGQQRYITMKKFEECKLTWCNKTYERLSAKETLQFLTYKISVLQYKNATYNETIQIFDDFQNGIALTNGQRFFARMDTQLVKYARERFMTPGKYYNKRMKAIFGDHFWYKDDNNDKYNDNDTKSKKNLTNIMALAGCVAHGSKNLKYMTTSYDILGPMLQELFDELVADELVEKLLKIFEEANNRTGSPLTKAEKKQFWSVGYISGYILASIILKPDYTIWAKRWVEYIVDIRKKPSTIELLHDNIPTSRNWNIDRWETGLKNLETLPSNKNIISI